VVVGMGIPPATETAATSLVVSAYVSILVSSSSQPPPKKIGPVEVVVISPHNYYCLPS
jgi:hypothetical protein